jgi:hypothetical protein
VGAKAIFALVAFSFGDCLAGAGELVTVFLEKTASQGLDSRK